MITQFAEAVFNVLREFISEMGMPDAQFFFGRGIRFQGGAVGEARLLPALNGSL
jgi:hypothetical protein